MGEPTQDSVRQLFEDVMQRGDNLTPANLNSLTQTFQAILSPAEVQSSGRRRSSKKRSTQRKQKRRQRRGSRRAY